MTAPSKQAPAKALSLDDDDAPVSAKKPREAAETPRPKKPRGDNPRDGDAAERAGLPSGFEDDELMAQVAEELEAGEVLHYACRPARKLARLQAAVYAAFAAVFVLIPGVIGISGLSKAKKSEDYLFALVPLAVAAVAGIATYLAPRGRMRQAGRGWYAVTARRALVFEVTLLGGKGEVTGYTPGQVRNMWVRKSAWLKGGGDVVFKTKVTITTRISERSEKTSKSTTHYGFIGVEDVEAVRDVLERVLLSDADDEE